MKTIPTMLAILLTCLAPLAIGCSAAPGDAFEESAGSAGQDLINNGGGPGGTSQDDLEANGYTCGIVGTFPGIRGVMTCVKQGGPTYTCTPAGVCTQALTKPPPDHGPIRVLPIGPVNVSANGG